MNTTLESQTRGQDAPSFHGQTLQFSQFYASRYIQERRLPSGELAADQTLDRAAARLQWTLEQARPTLSGRFTEGDVGILLGCYQADLFFLDQFNSISSDLCECHGVDVDGCESTSPGQLVNKLRELDPLQRLTLGDALEQACHRGLKGGHIAGKFFRTLGIELA